MARVASIVPQESDLLCEQCGYILNGLPASHNCPECGKPIDQSVGTHRHPAAFEMEPGLNSFVRTSASLIFSPRHFFRTLITRSTTSAARTFASIHLTLTTLLFTSAAVGHLRWIMDQFSISEPFIRMDSYLICVIVGLPLILILLMLLTRLAAWLSAIEARFWGMRLPYPVVLRGLTFHSAHYLPVGLLANLVVWGYRALIDLGFVRITSDTIYLYTLSGTVIVSAIYLFQTYWIAMRSMMYANR